jgi:hypothetical protein
MVSKTKKVLFITSLMIFGLSLFIFTIMSIVLLSEIGDMLSMKLGICGINGITIKIGKLDYLVYMYVAYISVIGIILWGIVKVYYLILEYFFGSIFQTIETKTI